MNKNKTLSFLLSALLVTACSKESPELLPCMCDGSESTLGLFDCMCEPMKKKPVRRISYIQDERPANQTLYLNQEQRDAYIYLHQRRDSFAPIKLEHVDFRIKKGRKYDEFDTKLGNYRFRIFGCRRENKNVFLNKGRTMQKDMHFFDIFYEQMNDYYPVVVEKNNPYYMESDRIAHPEYLVTAEIEDYFMNICDEFDWENVKQKKLRSGTSEIAVTWRITDLTGEDVYCKGTTTGYGQISEGEPKGETLLIERAFEDALNKLPEIECFNSTVSQRVHPDDLKKQLDYIKERSRTTTSFRTQYDKELKGIGLLQECATGIAPNPQNNDLDLPIISETSGNSVQNRYVRGRYDNQGTFIEDKKGDVFGQLDNRGRFIEDKKISGVSCVSKNEVRGTKVNGRFIEQVEGPLVGFVDTKGNFIENAMIEEASGVIGDGFCDEGLEPLFITETTIVETSGIGGDGSCIDVVSDSRPTGKIIRQSNIDGSENVFRVMNDECIDAAGNVIITSSGSIEQNGGATGSGISETIVVRQGDECISISGNGIDQNGGVTGSGSVVADNYFKQKDDKNVEKIIAENSNECVAAVKYRRIRNTRTAGLSIDQRCRAIEINDDACTVVKNLEENVTIADDYWIDVPLNTTEPEAVANRNMAEESFANANNRFCIKNHTPYDTLNPQNLYTVRASVVAVENTRGQKGAGLIIADNLILTSADLIVKDNNNFNIKTINGKQFKAGALRVNPNKNVAVLLLETPTQYSPLPLSLELPEVNKDILMTLGLLDFDKEGEGYLDNNGRVLGYRWTEERGAEIIVDTFVQSVTVGGALIDKNGNIVGISHDSKKLEDGPDLFIPIETALKSLGLEICGREFKAKKPAAVKTYETPLADAIDASKDKAPKPMTGKERK